MGSLFSYFSEVFHSSEKEKKIPAKEKEAPVPCLLQAPLSLLTQRSVRAKGPGKGVASGTSDV